MHKLTTSRPSWTNQRGVARRLLLSALALPVEVERVTTSRLSLQQGPDRVRLTTIVELHGGGHVGRGEDIAYDATAHEHTDGMFTGLDVAGSWTIGTLSAHLDTQRLALPSGTDGDDKSTYHRWAIEGALLDLALRQAGTDLATLAGAPWPDLNFAVSMGLGSPPSLDRVRDWADVAPGITFKIDANSQWSEEVARGLADLDGAVTTIDFKGLYHGTWADNEPIPAVYELVARLLPGALLEDGKLTPEVLDALDEHALARLTWDYPITCPEDVPGLPGSTAVFSDIRPAAINIKPSRFGTLERLLGTIDLCDREGIPCYSGGQYELGIGRTQVQEIAALCFPDGPNDCAPVAWHGAAPGDDVPRSPLRIPAHTGFGWM